MTVVDPAETMSYARRLEGEFERTGEAATLIEALAQYYLAVNHTLGNDPERGRRCSLLGAALWRTYERTNDLNDLQDAVEANRAAVSATAPGSGDFGAFLSRLALTLRAVYRRTTDVTVLRELAVLGGVLQEHFEGTGDVEALIEAVEVHRAAAAGYPAGHSSRAAVLHSLGAGLSLLSERTGDRPKLEEAITCLRAAVEAAPAGRPERAGGLNSLGIGLRTLFTWTGDTGVLLEAIHVHRTAVTATPAGRPAAATALNSLAVALGTWFEHTRDPVILAEAVEIARAAAAAGPADHRDQAAYSNNLAILLTELVKLGGGEDLAAEAVELARAAVAATAPGHPDLAGYLNNLGTALRTQGESAGTPGFLAGAIDAGRAAVAAAPADHPDRAMYQHSLGHALWAQFERTGDAGLLTEAEECCEAAGRNAGAPAVQRIDSYLALELVSRAGNRGPQGALAAVEEAVRLLPQLTTRSLARRDREHQLGRLSRLAGLAAAAAVDAGAPERAVELLEQTRGILMSDALHVRGGDLERLRRDHAGLADAVERLHGRLTALESAASGRRETSAAWNGLLARIRTLDGFETFLTTPRIAELARQAHEGPIVLVYTSPTRCDALIIADGTGPPVRVVPLPGLTTAGVRRQAARLAEECSAVRDLDAGPSAPAAAAAGLFEILAWLWDTVTGPVLEALGHTAAPAHPDRDEDWPRVWWCPVGPLAYLPLHSAGHHADSGMDTAAPVVAPRTVLDRVVSSYTTTIQSLAHARTERTATAGDPAVIVAVPEAPGARRLPGVTAEAKVLSRLIPGARTLPHPTRDAVLAALPANAVAHFACHGATDWADPAASHLVLDDSETAPLTVADIGNLNLNCALAYLSACSTTVTVPDLADEAVHITGAFHLAGYRHVVGTLWGADDTSAGELAEAFYTHLTSADGARLDHDRAAFALHRATRALRARHSRHPAYWAGHTHTGA